MAYTLWSRLLSSGSYHISIYFKRDFLIIYDFKFPVSAGCPQIFCTTFIKLMNFTIYACRTF